MRTAVLVELDRGGVTESRHRGSLVVVDCQGNDIHAAGDPDHAVFIRSSVKPFVSALVVATGAADALGLGAAELAIIGGSHSGTDTDAAIVRGILDRIGCPEDALRNGSGGPDDEATRARFLTAGEEPGPLRQMCSGEHAGILAIAAHGGWSVDGYWEEDHPAQAAIAGLVGRLFGGDGRTGRDNCAVPTWQVPLSSVARGYACLARPERLPDGLRDLERPFTAVRDAMLAHPERISGAGQLDTDLTATDGAFVAKEGAEGLLGIGSVATGLGVALTIEDGDLARRATAVVALATLSSLRLLDDEPERQLRERHWPGMTDSLGRPVGEARPAFHLPPAE